MTDLIKPHGGNLKELIVSSDQVEGLKQASNEYPSWDLTRAQLCDLELLLTGAFSPLEGFLGREDYERVLEELCLEDGTLWPVPIVLDISEQFAETVEVGQAIVLRDPEGVPIALMELTDLWRPEKSLEALRLFGSDDQSKPQVNRLLNETHPVYAGGRVRGLQLPVHYDYQHLRGSPCEVRERLKKWGWRRIVAYQTQSPMHRAEHALTVGVAQRNEANLLIQGVACSTKSGDVEYFSRVRCYEHILKHYQEQTTDLNLLPLVPRNCGTRESLWHALVHRNFGCTHFIVEQCCGSSQGFSQADAADEMRSLRDAASRYQDELGIELVFAPEMVYAEDRAEFVPVAAARDEHRRRTFADGELYRRLREGLEVPAWFSYPEIVTELRKSHPPRYKQGFTVFFTGLSGAGKSTIANALLVKLLEMGGRPVTLLDGDIVRKHLSSELGFSKEDRNINILRIGYVASEITKNGGIAICAPIAPYASTRMEVREMITQYGGFVEVHVATPLTVCEQRDRKGLYARARAGLIKEFTGISDPYEPPQDPDLRINTENLGPDEAAHQVVLKLERLGYIR